MADTSQITLRGARFDERAQTDLARVRTFGKPDIDLIEGRVAGGVYTLFAVEMGGARVGTMVLSWERDGGGTALFCNALAIDRFHGSNIVPAVVEMLGPWAKEQGANKLRFQTARDGLMRVCEGLGFKRQYVMEKEI